MHLEVKMPENGRNKVFRSKQSPNKVPLLFLNMKMLEEGFARSF